MRHLTFEEIVEADHVLYDSVKQSTTETMVT